MLRHVAEGFQGCVWSRGFKQQRLQHKGKQGVSPSALSECPLYSLTRHQKQSPTIQARANAPSDCTSPSGCMSDRRSERKPTDPTQASITNDGSERGSTPPRRNAGAHRERRRLTLRRMPSGKSSSRRTLKVLEGPSSRKSPPSHARIGAHLNAGDACTTPTRRLHRDAMRVHRRRPIVRQRALLPRHNGRWRQW